LAGKGSHTAVVAVDITGRRAAVNAAEAAAAGKSVGRLSMSWKQ